MIIHTLVSLAGLAISRADMTEERATQCNAALISNRRPLRWIAGTEIPTFTVSADAATPNIVDLDQLTGARKAWATRRAKLAEKEVVA